MVGVLYLDQDAIESYTILNLIYRACGLNKDNREENCIGFGPVFCFGICVNTDWTLKITIVIIITERESV